MKNTSPGFATLGAALAFVCLPTEARDLNFEDRVRAQEAIERVYYSHQIGATKPFEEAVPREVLEKKVATYLKQSVALEKLWHTPVTATALQRELERMAEASRMPERLQELYAALGNDPFLVAECLARPVLVDRLSRNFFAFDGRIHGAANNEAEVLRAGLERDGVTALAGDPRRNEVEIVKTNSQDDSFSGTARPREEPREIRLSLEEFARWRSRAPSSIGAIGPVREEREAFTIDIVLEETPERARIATFSVEKENWDDWWREESMRFDSESVDAVGRGVEVRPAAGRRDANGRCDLWDNGSLDDVPDSRSGHTAVWTGTHMVVWGGTGLTNSLNTGGRYDPATDTWVPTSTVNGPEAGDDHTAVWTGSRMIVWGGQARGYTYLNTGGRYDPLADTWEPTSTLGAPSGRYQHTAVWTGSQMVVWGGWDGGGYLDTGGRYDPSTDTWTPTSTAGPSRRGRHTAVWTGDRMIVWGGDAALKAGGSYDPVKDRWSPTSTVGAPPGRTYHSAVWTGREMIVWGGNSYDEYLRSGGRYDPITDSWTLTSEVGTPGKRARHVAVWTGSRMVVWGGLYHRPEDTGARYDPATDTWEPTSTESAPTGRYEPSAIWTGDLVIVWGGAHGLYSLNSGGRYDPDTDTWTPTSMGEGPMGRFDHTAVWTGREMVVWGGSRYSGSFKTGGRYDPATDSWTPTSTVGAPTGRNSHSAVWTGAEMIVWGGTAGKRWYQTDYFSTGARYDPVADHWVATSTVGAPEGRRVHTAVWSGTRMIVWGGMTYGGGFDTGGLYDPATDSWTPTSRVGSPTPRAVHTAIWTGSRMVVWGGAFYDSGTSYYFDSGGQYDPTTDTWTPTSVVGAPAGRSWHTAIWTGSRMVIWGGHFYDGTSYYLDTGGQYDPTADTWTPTTQTSAPTARFRHRAVWAGSLMVVWGGSDGYWDVGTGGRYDPVTDMWTPTSNENAPSARAEHTMVWTGSRVIVWGGSSVSSGGSYVIDEFCGTLPLSFPLETTTPCASGLCNTACTATNSAVIDHCEGRAP